MYRKKYVKLVEWKNKESKPLILLGARQVGKTYLLKHFAKEFFNDFHYFNFEQNKNLHKIFEIDLSSFKIVEELELYIGKKINSNDLIIFDEIQDCPRAITSLKYFAEDNKFKIIAAGSLLGLQLHETSFPVGKVEFEYLYPMSFEEFLMASNQFLYKKYIETELSEVSINLHELLNEEYLKYLVIGGMPEVVQYYSTSSANKIEVFEGVRKLQNDILKSYLADFAKHSGKVNSMHIEKVWYECAAQIGKSQDGSIGRFKFKGVIPQRKQFLDFQNIFNWLDKAGLINRCYHVDKNELPLKAYVKESFFKPYIFDVGLLIAMLEISFRDILKSTLTTYKGYLAENYVANHLVSMNLGGLYYWQYNQSEIEFLFAHEGDIVPIEVKSGTRTSSKSLASYKNKFSPKKMIIYSMKNYHQNFELIKIPLWAIEKYKLKQ